MNIKNIPTVDYLIDIANLPEDKTNLLDKCNTGMIQQAIFKYYEQNNEIGVFCYEFQKGTNIDYVCKTTLGTSIDNPPYIDDIRKLETYFTEYSENGLKVTGLDDDKSWNGKKITVLYDKGGLLTIGNTDYYSDVIPSLLLYFEALKVSMNVSNLDNISNDMFPLRNEILSKLNHFYKPRRPVSASSGGAIIANTGKTWKLILGRRSKNTHINRNMVSILPYGGVEPKDINNGNFTQTTKREFKEELFNNDIKADRYLRKNVNINRVSIGWNLRDADFTVGHSLIIDNSISYDILLEMMEKNKEVSDLILIDIMNLEELKNILNLNMMSGSAISIVCDSLIYFNNSDKYPNLPYTIERFIE